MGPVAAVAEQHRAAIHEVIDRILVGVAVVGLLFVSRQNLVEMVRA